MPRAIVLSSAARKFLLDLTDARLESRLREHIDAIAGNPFPAGVKKLKGTAHSFRVRVGDHRIVYEVDPRQPVVFIAHIGDRKDIYR